MMKIMIIVLKVIKYLKILLKIIRKFWEEKYRKISQSIDKEKIMTLKTFLFVIILHYLKLERKEGEKYSGPLLLLLLIAATCSTELNIIEVSILTLCFGSAFVKPLKRSAFRHICLFSDTVQRS